ncbi:hypothetical protein [Micromonospora chersina]
MTDFKNRFGLNANEWQVVVVMLAIVATFWLIRRAYSSLQAPTSGELVFAICDNAERLDDHRGLFLFEGRDTEGIDRVLVYFDEVWECFLLPHANVQAWDLADVSVEGPLTQYAGRLIGVSPEQIDVTPLRSLALRSTKFSEFYKREKSYTFDFLHVIVRGSVRQELLKPSFVAGGREYRWMSIAELLRHKPTNAKNKDVLHHLEGHVAEFFLQLPDSFTTRLITSDSSGLDIPGTRKSENDEESHADKSTVVREAN